MNVDVDITKSRKGDNLVGNESVDCIRTTNHETEIF